MMISIRFSTILFLFIVLFLGTFSFVIAWPIENGVAVCTTTTSQTAPRSIEDGFGGAIICWRENRSGNYFFCAQRINSYGSTLWNPTGVTLSTSTNRKDYRVIVSDNAGGGIIVWDELINGNYDLFAQRIDSNGTILWGAGGLTISTATLSQYMPSAIPDGSGGVFITWRDSRDYSTSYDDIYAQRVNSDGSTLWTENGVPVCTDSNIQLSPKITGDGSGGFVVTWCDTTPVGYYKDIYAQRVDGNGNVQWATRGVAVCTVNNDQDWQSIVSDGSGGAIIIWRDPRLSPGGALYAQRINSSGFPLWSLNGVAVCTVNYVYAIDNIKMVSDGSGGAVFVWMDNRLIDTYPDLYAQRINSNGNTLWGVDGLAIATALNYQEYEMLTPDDMGGAVITWCDGRSGVSDIYAQHVNSTGSTLWANNGLAICTSAQYQTTPWITRDESGGAIIVWQDSRPVSQTDVYAQRVDGNGNTDFVPVGLVQFEAILPE